MTTEENSIVGRPIRGEIEYFDTSLVEELWPDDEEDSGDTAPVEQKPLTDFIAALDAVFAFPEVQSIRWEQYTPYFNDGDPCKFSADDVGFRIDGIDEGVLDEHGCIAVWLIRSADDHSQRNAAEYPQISDALFTAMNAFDAAIIDGAHDADLLEHFGDPAQVVATRAGFDVEFYEHD
ncbi:hypothetical protein [Nocardia jinanensis]|uniref:Uncharacterized protein n=1 Tax=Nocardia jinanensis TaxID=382504 RepID=A0A917VZA1_9NOCA|nr:hypothetical protein [Nocardia jinanensis]GGL42202.1 hypothetical protein GCM10011588_66200 [Nocardia jinanensis]